MRDESLVPKQNIQIKACRIYYSLYFVVSNKIVSAEFLVIRKVYLKLTNTSLIICTENSRINELYVISAMHSILITRCLICFTTETFNLTNNTNMNFISV